jgi:hypothetical protein
MSSSLAPEAFMLSPPKGRFTLSAPAIALLGWLACCAVMLALFAHHVRMFDFMDTDDAMRLAQVRDWIGGQGWLDVSQHRVNPPTGGPMHWSRLVDLPIACVILLARPLVGTAAAEMLACALVPLLTLGLLAAALFHAAWRVAGEAVAAAAVLLLCVTPTILIQFTPTRIDHHGCQAVMALLALCGALDPRRMRGGGLAGVAIAAWLQISTEGLPYAALFGGLFVLRHWIDPHEGDRLRGFAVVGLAAPLLLIVTKGPSALIHSACDALSAVYVWPLMLFGGLVAAGMRLTDQRRLPARIGVTLLAGAAAAGACLWLGADCLTRGPFHELTPLAYDHWYRQVLEGRPLWEQSAALAAVSLLPSLLGLVAPFAAARAAPKGDTRTRWLVLGLLLLGATAVSAMVMRAMTVAHVLALPGIGWLLIVLFRRAQALPTAPARVLLSAALMLLTPVGLSSAAATLLSPLDAPGPQKTNCRAPQVLAPLGQLPPSLLFAPLDIGPDILVRTPHSVIGTGHHRNVVGINAVTHAFLSDPAAARADIMAGRAGRGADYLVLCPRMNEMLLYAKSAPNGLAAQLARGHVPGWLEPVPAKGPLKIYRVRRD